MSSPCWSSGKTFFVGWLDYAEPFDTGVFFSILPKDTQTPQIDERSNSFLADVEVTHHGINITKHRAKCCRCELKGRSCYLVAPTHKCNAGTYWGRASFFLIKKCQLQGSYCHFIPFLIQLTFLQLGRCYQWVFLMLWAGIGSEPYLLIKNCLIEDLLPLDCHRCLVQQLSQKSLWNCQVGERGPCNLPKSGSSYWSSYFRVSCLWYYIMKAHFFKFSLPLPPCTLQITAEAAGARAAAALKVRQSSCCWSGSSVRRKILIWSPTSLHTQEVWALLFPRE